VGRAVQVAGARREGFGFGRGWIRARRELLRVSGDMHGWRARERPASVADLSAPRAAAGAGRPSAWGLDRPVGLRPLCVAHAAAPLAPFRAPALPRTCRRARCLSPRLLARASLPQGGLPGWGSPRTPGGQGVAGLANAIDHDHAFTQVCSKPREGLKEVQVAHVRFIRYSLGSQEEE